MKKFLSGLLIGAFVFGIGALDVQPAVASALDDVKQTKNKFDKNKQQFDKAKDKFDKRDGDNGNRPAPPTDENGNPLPPPDKNGDNGNRPAPPTDENGNPLPPPDKNGDNNNRK